jgi:hypothetical protein
MKIVTNRKHITQEKSRINLLCLKERFVLFKGSFAVLPVAALLLVNSSSLETHNGAIVAENFVFCGTGS